MESDELAERIAQVMEIASPRLRKTLFSLPRERKFPEDVAVPEERLRLQYWQDWKDLLISQLKGDPEVERQWRELIGNQLTEGDKVAQLQPIGVSIPRAAPGASASSTKGGYDHD